MESRNIVDSITSEPETPRRPRNGNRPEGLAARQRVSARNPLSEPPRSSLDSHITLLDK